MAQSEFDEVLVRLGLTRRVLARLIASLTGRKPIYRTIDRWGPRDPPDAAWALLAVMERHPEILAADIRKASAAS